MIAVQLVGLVMLTTCTLVALQRWRHHADAAHALEEERQALLEEMLADREWCAREHIRVEVALTDGSGRRYNFPRRES